MSSTNTDPTIVLDTGPVSDVATAVAFHPDGKHLVSGGNAGIRRWRLADSQEVGKQEEKTINAICVSKDHKWIVCGTSQRGGASVWDEEVHEKVISVEVASSVWAVDISPDSTRFATGTYDNNASIWSITTGQRLVGPLQHSDSVTGTKFSSNGKQIATACYTGSIRVFDSSNGNELININTSTPSAGAITPLAWSTDGQRIFTTAKDGAVRSFDVSTGSQLIELLNLGCGSSIALAGNGKFIAAIRSPSSIFFLDASTLARIGPVIKGTEEIQSISISPDSSLLATGRYDKKIFVHDLSSILPDMYGPFRVSTRNEVQQDRQPSTLGDDTNKLPDPDPEDTGKPRSKGHGEDGDDLLEHEVPSNAPVPQSFDYDEPPSPTSVDPWEDEISLSHAIPRSTDAPPVTSAPESRPEENLDTVESRQGRSMFIKWLQRGGNKGAASLRPGRLSEKSRQPADRRSPLSPARLDVTDKGPSKMVAGKRQPRAVAKPVPIVKQQDKLSTKAVVRGHPKEGASRSGQGGVDPKQGDPARQANYASQPSPARVHVMERGPDDSIIAIRVPTWVLGTHEHVTFRTVFPEHKEIAVTDTSAKYPTGRRILPFFAQCCMGKNDGSCARQATKVGSETLNE